MTMQCKTLRGLLLLGAIVWAQNVGIGTANPRERLQIGDRFTFHDGGWKYIGYNVYTGGTPAVDRYIVNDEASRMVLTDDGRIRFQVAPSGNADNPITWREAMRIENNGSVLGRFRHVTYHSFRYSNTGGGFSWLPPNTTAQTVWLPAASGDGVDDCPQNGTNMCGEWWRRKWATPYNGRIVKVTLCILDNGGSNPDIQAGLAFFRRPNGGAPTTSTYTASVFSINDSGCQTITLPENTFTFNEGDVIAVGIYKRGNNSDRVEDLDYFVTIVWEYEAWD